MAGVWESVEAAVLAGDAERVADLCLPLDEATRTDLFPAAWTLWGTLLSGGDERVWWAIQTALFATGAPHEAQIALPERMEQLARARPRAWRDEWVRSARWRGGSAQWRTYRALVRTGDCDPLPAEDATRLMLSALQDRSIDPVALLLAEPDVLEHEIWAPFGLPAGWYAAYTGWEPAILGLAEAGHLPRERVLGELLGLIARSERDHAYEHLVHLHDRRFVPTPSEIATHRDTYLRLLADERGPVADLAAGALIRLDREHPLDAAALRLDVRAMTRVERIVALAGRVLEREPGLRPWLDQMTAHPDAAAQEAAREIVEGWSTRAAWEAIELAADAGEPERVADLCLALDESDRARLSARSAALAQRLHHGRWNEPVPRAGQTARFALGPLITDDEFHLEPPYSHLERLVRSRPRRWRDAWAQWTAHRGHADKVASWRTLRRLIRDGLCTAPDSTGLLLRALDESERPADELRAFPELLEAEIWAPFAVEHAAWNDYWPAWQAALTELSADGTIARERLLDETLGALLAHTGAGTLKALFAFHDKQLKPSADELAAHVDRYLRLLESDRDATLGFALKALVRLDRRHPVDGRELLDRLAPAVAVRAKAHAKRAVELTGSVLDREPALAGQGVAMLLDALGHPAAEVQAAALDVLVRHPPKPRALAPLIDLVDPGLRARVSALAGAEPQRALPAAAAVEPTGPEAVTPVADVDELLDLASRLLEGLDDPDEFERLVDGLSRLAGAPVPEGRRTALVRRAKRGANTWEDCVEKLCLAWFGVPASPFGTGDRSGAVERRLAVVRRRLEARRPAVLLSAPTHRGGFLDAGALRERLAAGEPVEDDDLALALLRVPADDALAILAEVRQPREQLPASWDSAALLTDPPPAVRRRLPPVPSPASPGRLLAGPNPPYHDYSPLFARVLGLVWPTVRAHYYAGVRVGEEAHPAELAAALTTMLYPGEPLGSHAAYLIAEGLHTADANRPLAADVLADALATGRIDAAELGGLLAGVAAVRKPARLAAALEHVTLPALQPVLEAMFAALTMRTPQLIGVVDLLRRIAQDTRTPIRDPRARAYLESLTAKSGALARAALAV